MKTDDLIKAISTDAGRPAPSMAGAWGLALVAAALVALVVFTAMLGPRPDIAEAVATLRFPFKFVVTLALAGSALAVLRQGAPTRPRLAGAVAGLLAGGVAATFYAAHCTDDSPLFVATWYTVAVAILAALGALLAPRVARR